MLRTLGTMSTHEASSPFCGNASSIKLQSKKKKKRLFFLLPTCKNVVRHGHKELQITYKSTSKQSNTNPKIELVKVDIFAKWRIMKIGLLWVRFKLTLNIRFKIYMYLLKCSRLYWPTFLFFWQRTNLTKKTLVCILRTTSDVNIIVNWSIHRNKIWSSVLRYNAVKKMYILNP